MGSLSEIHPQGASLGRLGLADTEEGAMVSFMQTLSDGFMPVSQQ
jgi:hypothetical protein